MTSKEKLQTFWLETGLAFQDENLILLIFLAITYPDDIGIFTRAPGAGVFLIRVALRNCSN